MKCLISHWRPDIVSGAELAITDMTGVGDNRNEYIMLVPGNGDLSDHFSKNNYKVWTRKIETPRRLFPGLHIFQSFYFSRKLLQNKIDLVLCNTFPAASRVRTACRLSKTPMAIYIREYIQNTKLHRHILNSADGILAVSKDVSNYLEQFGTNSSIYVAHDHINLEPIRIRLQRHRQSARSLLPCGNGQSVIGFVGRLTPYKQAHLFLRAASHILTEEPSTKFVVVGSSVCSEVQYEQSLKRLAINLGISDRVFFLGQRHDVIEILTECKALCVISDREPFPRSILEAQVAGCPVVVSNTGGCPEMVKNEESGLTVRVDEIMGVEELSTAVLRLLRDSSLKDKLAIGGMRQVETGFGSMNPVVEFESILHSIISQATLKYGSSH